jgi:hypothetical protein
MVGTTGFELAAPIIKSNTYSIAGNGTAKRREKILARMPASPAQKAYNSNY